MAMVHAVQHHTHALPCRDEGGDADEPAQERKYTPAAAGVAEGDEQVCEEASEDAEYA